MAGLSGAGAVTAELAIISTGCACSTATTKAGGAVCELTGICTDGITTTSDPSGSGASSVELADIFTDCEPSADGTGLAGTMSEATGTCGDETIITTASMVARSGDGDNIAESAIISTVCVFCIGTIKDTGAECVPTGICGDEIITTSRIAGDGVGTVESGDTCTDTASSTGGPVPSGLSFVAIGICGERTTTIIASMVELAGLGAASGALECTGIACELCTGITKATGVVFGLTGTCGDGIITTADPNGSGAATTDEWADTCTGGGSTKSGQGASGLPSAATGTCTAGTITIIDIMEEPAGRGDASNASDTISTVAAICGATTRDPGVVCVPTGTCGERIITTDQVGGTGVRIAGSGGTCIACASSSAGLAPLGSLCVGIGTWSDETITITNCMAEPSGFGADSGALECTGIACGHCTGITKAAGAGFGLTGTCGVETITIGDLCGVGAGTVGSDTTCTVPESSTDGLVFVGFLFDASGVCGDEIITATDCMDAPAGSGANSVEWDIINIDCAFSRKTTTVTGDGFELTGTCGEKTSTTAHLVGFGDVTVALVGICTATEFTSGLMAIAGESYAITGTCGGAIITTTNSMAAFDGSGVSIAASASICTVSGPFSGTTKGTGEKFGPTGICGGETITTNLVAGSGVGTVGWDTTCIDCAF